MPDSKTTDERDVELSADLSVELTDALVDGREIDWQKARRESRDGDRRTAGLELLDEVSRVFRQTAASQSEEPVLFEWGPLRVIEKLDEGSFGEVYRAVDPTLGREVALKLRKTRRADHGIENRGLGSAWLDEARRLARIRHPHVLTVHGAALHDGREGLWSDLLTGVTLREWLAQQGTLGAHEVIGIGTGLCQALAAIHAKDMVHGDVKLSNVMREQGGHLVLVDLRSSSDKDTRSLSSNQGSPLTSAPEVLNGDRATVQSDLYSLGALLFQLSTGKPPIDASSYEELTRLALQGRVEPLRDLRPDFPSALTRVIDRALSPQPGQRPQSAGAFEAALHEIRPGGRVGGRSRLLPSMVIASLAMVTLALITLVFWWVPRGRETVEFVPTGKVQARLVQVGPPDVSLASGSSIQPGDQLGLEVELAQPAYVYVLNEDQQGEIFVLFPLPEGVEQNPLSQGRHRLPGMIDGNEQNWVVTSRGGVEVFLVVASPTALPAVEDLIETLDFALPSRLPEAGEIRPIPSGEVVRGVGGITSHRFSGSRLEALRSRLNELGTQDIWVRTIELNNPH